MSLVIMKTYSWTIYKFSKIATRSTKIIRNDKLNDESTNNLSHDLRNERLFELQALGNETPNHPQGEEEPSLLPITWQLSHKPFKPIPTRYRLDIIALAVSPISGISIGSRLMPVHPLSPVERPFLRALYAPARTHARTHAIRTHETSCRSVTR